MRIKARQFALVRRPSLRMYTDVALIATSGPALLALLVIDSRQMPLLALRFLLGVLFVLLIPGYCLSVALFPSSNSIDSAERCGLSVGLSISCVSVLVVILDRLPWGIRPLPILLAELGVSFAALCIATLRRSTLMRADAFDLGRLQFVDRRQGVARFARTATRRIAIGCLLVAGFSAGWSLTAPPPDPAPTEFYILAQHGLAEGYPTEVQVSRSVELTLGIVNREASAHSFRTEIWVADVWNKQRKQRVYRDEPMLLAEGTVSERAVRWQMPWVGKDQQVDLLLFVDDQLQPYRHLRLLLNVVPSDATAEAWTTPYVML